MSKRSKKGNGDVVEFRMCYPAFSLQRAPKQKLRERCARDLGVSEDRVGLWELESDSAERMGITVEGSGTLDEIIRCKQENIRLHQMLERTTESLIALQQQIQRLSLPIMSFHDSICIHQHQCFCDHFGLNSRPILNDKEENRFLPDITFGKIEVEEKKGKRKEEEKEEEQETGKEEKKEKEQKEEKEEEKEEKKEKKKEKSKEEEVTKEKKEKEREKEEETDHKEKDKDEKKKKNGNGNGNGSEKEKEVKTKGKTKTLPKVVFVGNGDEDLKRPRRTSSIPDLRAQVEKKKIEKANSYVMRGNMEDQGRGNCRECECNKFLADNKVSWLCESCGHTKLKHCSLSKTPR